MKALKLWGMTLILLTLVLLGCRQNKTELKSEPLPSEVIPAPAVIQHSLQEEPAQTPSQVQPRAELMVPVGQEIMLTTKDNFKIAATIYRSNSSYGVVLLPMMAHNRSSYDPIVNDLALRYSVIALDMRGHGKSQGRFDRFSDEEFGAMVNDVGAVVDELGKNNVTIIGASIGANVALRYASSDSRVKSIVMISPGIEYRTVRTWDIMPYFDRPSLIIVSKGDEYSYQSSRKLVGMNNKTFIEEYEGDKHGTDLFGTGKGVEGFILRWVSETLGLYV